MKNFFTIKFLFFKKVVSMFDQIIEDSSSVLLNSSEYVGIEEYKQFLEGEKKIYFFYDIIAEN